MILRLSRARLAIRLIAKATVQTNAIVVSNVNRLHCFVVIHFSTTREAGVACMTLLSTVSGVSFPLIDEIEHFMAVRLLRQRSC